MMETGLCCLNLGQQEILITIPINHIRCFSDLAKITKKQVRSNRKRKTNRSWTSSVSMRT
jgi:hypothetical protein